LFIEFLGRAKASAGEVRTQLYIALDAEYLSTGAFGELHACATSVSKQISGLMKYLGRHQQEFKQRAIPPSQAIEDQNV
jgi:four helix bundle protein